MDKVTKAPGNTELDCVIVYANMPDSTTAEDMAEALIVKEMAATVSLIPEVKTYKASKKYNVKEKNEIIMIIKTRKSHVSKLTEFLKLNCPYQDDKVDVTSVPILDGNPPFLKWIVDKSVNKS